MSHLMGRPLSFIVKTMVDKELSRMTAQSQSLDLLSLVGSLWSYLYSSS